MPCRGCCLYAARVSDQSLLAICGFILDVRDDVRVEWNDLLPWLERRPQLVRRLHRLGDPDAHRHREGEYGPVGDELYPLGRLVDIPISPHQPVCDRKVLNGLISEYQQAAWPKPSFRTVRAPVAIGFRCGRPGSEVRYFLARQAVPEVPISANWAA
jgi:hypothetical protein